MSRVDALEANLLALVKIVGELQHNLEICKQLYLEIELQIIDVNDRLSAVEERDDS